MDLFPPTVLALQKAGIAHRWRQPEHEVVLACPCGGVLHLHEDKDWHWCWKKDRQHGEPCPIENLPLSAIIEKLSARVAA